MSRNFVVVTGAICWALVVVDVTVHLIGGNVFIPVTMAIAGAVWVGLRRSYLRFREARARN